MLLCNLLVLKIVLDPWPGIQSTILHYAIYILHCSYDIWFATTCSSVTSHYNQCRSNWSYKGVEVVVLISLLLLQIINNSRKNDSDTALRKIKQKNTPSTANCNSISNIEKPTTFKWCLLHWLLYILNMVYCFAWQLVITIRCDSSDACSGICIYFYFRQSYTFALVNDVVDKHSHYVHILLSHSTWLSPL